MSAYWAIYGFFTVLNIGLLSGSVWLLRKTERELDECYLLLAKATWVIEEES